MTITNIIDKESKTQTIRQNLKNIKNIEYKIKNGYIEKIKLTYNLGDELASEIVLNNGKIEYFGVYGKTIGKSEGYIIKPDIDNILNSYEKYNAEIHHNPKNLPNTENLIENQNEQYIFETEENGDFIYEGSGMNNMRHGLGKLKLNEPSWKNVGNEMHINNEWTKDKYEGNFDKNKYHGFGTMYYHNGNKYYSGEWKKGKPHGEVEIFYDSGDIEFCGTMTKGIKNGQGTLYFHDGIKKYEGLWKDDKYDSYGKQFNSEGGFNDRKAIVYMDGNFSKDSFEGTQYDTGIKKIRYEGQMCAIYQNQNPPHREKILMQQWVAHGTGKGYWPNGNLQVSGTFKKEEFKNGSMHHYDGEIKYKGTLKEGMRSGYGEVYDLAGVLCSKGIWNKNVLKNLEMPDEYKGLGYEILKITNLFYIGEVKEGRANGYGYLISSKTGKLTSEGYCKNGQKNGLIKFYYNEYEHQYIEALRCFRGGKEYGRYCKYHDNGKLSCRRACKKKNSIGFGIAFNENGKINFNKSYKK